MRSFLRRQWFLLGLAAVLTVGFAFPQPVAGFAQSALIRNGIVAGVMFLTALPLHTSVVWQTLSRPGPALLASAVNIGLVPLLAWLMSRLIHGDLATGLIVAATAPCTLASAAVWTRRAGGNDAVAVLVTLLTNATCFLWTPFWLVRMTRQSAEIDVGQMISDLGLLVVLPLVVAQLLRIARRVAWWASGHRRHLSLVAQVGILAMVLIGTVNAHRHLAATQWQQTIGVLDLVAMVVVVLCLHLSALWIGFVAARMLGMSRENRIAVAFSGSQKTLMVGLYIAMRYYGGLVLLPVVVYHVGQLVLDTIVADSWNRRQPQSPAKP